MKAIDIKNEIQQIDGVRFVSFIRKSLSDATPVGLNLACTALIRKHAHTVNVLREWCEERGLVLVDRNPNTVSIQIFLPNSIIYEQSKQRGRAGATQKPGKVTIRAAGSEAKVC